MEVHNDREQVAKAKREKKALVACGLSGDFGEVKFTFPCEQSYARKLMLTMTLIYVEKLTEAELDEIIERHKQDFGD